METLENNKIDKDLPEYETKCVDVELERGSYVKLISPRGKVYIRRTEALEAFKEKMGVDDKWTLK